jgi:NAD(P)-dependent dehydrogenase (short-subunit alcohol dehydrogenase family)
MVNRGRLEQRRAVVTGGARGIGLAVVRRLLEEGARVAIVDVDQSALAEAQRSLEVLNCELPIACCCDVSNPASVQILKDQVQQHLAGTDILINNAAILDWTAIEDLTPTRLQEVWKVNFGGAIACVQAFLPALSRSPYARIVNVSSINGMRGTSSSIAYNASKAALINLTKSLAVDLAPQGIIVNAVAPGFVDTRMSKLPDGSSEYDTQWFKEVYITHRRIPLTRPGLPEDIAGPVVFLCSDDARYITGQVLVVDGGVTATV